MAWRDGLRWATEGAWVQDLPPHFQWFGLGQASGQRLIVAAALVVLLALEFVLRRVAAGRAVYAVGSDREAARLAGIEPERVTFFVFVLMGALAGLAALLNAARFSAVPSNVGIGLELKAVAAVVVGGTAIRGGRGTLVGTLIGVALLGTIGPRSPTPASTRSGRRPSRARSSWRALVSDGCSDALERHAPRHRPLSRSSARRAPLRERLFPNGEWVLLLLLVLECAALQRDRQQLPDRGQRVRGHAAGRRGRAARARAHADHHHAAASISRSDR